MADTKITALTAIGANPIIPSTFPIPMVDLTDTSMAASGTTKKVTVNQILGAGGTATLASATITGDLTVDTSTLYVSSSADKVGIGTTSLSNEKLTVAGNISANAWLGRSNISVPAGDCSIFRSADNTLGFGIASSTAMTLNSNGLGIGTGSPSGASGRVLEIYGGAGQSRIALKNDTTGSASTDGSQIALVGSQLVIQNREASEITLETNNSERYRLASDGVATWSNVGGVAGTAMTLNATGLGVGEAPVASQKLTVNGNGSVRNGNRLYLWDTGNSTAHGIYNSGDNLTFSKNNGTTSMLLDSVGNLGIGVTPSAWVSYQKSIDFGGAGNYGSVSSRTNFAAFATNCYFNGTDWIYKNTNPANIYEHNLGAHYWRTAASGTAGTAITFTQAMTLDASGNLGIGVTPSYKLHVNGRVSYSTGIGEGADLTLSSTGTQVQHGISSTWTSQNFYTGGTSRVVMKQNGQVRFVPLAADPAGAEAGDVYYNSTSNKLKCYNGTTWNDLF